MSKKRPNSLVSEDTLIGICCGSENTSNRDSSESESSEEIFEDDSDADPTFDPEQPSKSAFQPRSKGPLMLTRLSISQGILTSESDKDDRPRDWQNDVQQNDPADDSSWNEVEEGNDSPYNHQFTFAEWSGPMHSPPQNVKPI
ncbi:hypothetical protein J6590_106436, partial [Homalodisca vitripennis]